MRSYPKVHHIGDPMLEGILDGDIEVEEKLDGSQFRIEIDINGMFHFGSHRVEFPTFENNQMFQKGVENCLKALSTIMGKRRDTPIHIFAEFLGKKQQNTLTYDNIPKNNLAIFDIIKDQHWFTPKEKKRFADKYGFDVVPILWKGDGKELTPERINELVKTKSYLGGAIVEGIVIKNYNKFFDPNKYAFMEGNFLVGKYVRQEFHELNNKIHAVEHTTMDKIKERYISEARWKKAIQKLREEGKLQNNMKDLALIIPEVKNDVRKECESDIKEQLWNMYGRQVIGGSVKGLAEWYNKGLMENKFNDE